MAEPEEKNIVETVTIPEYETVIIGRNVIRYLDEPEYDHPSDYSLMEMSTVYGEIYYEMKRFIESAYMPFLEVTSDNEQLADFLTLMDDAYGS
jgi:hypothetical protein